ncbi:hypothetical protein OSTOST_02652 [Ostertagia ostertagi]
MSISRLNLSMKSRIVRCCRTVLAFCFRNSSAQQLRSAIEEVPLIAITLLGQSLKAHPFINIVTVVTFFLCLLRFCLVSLRSPFPQKLDCVRKLIQIARPETLYFTRETVTKVQSRKRCPGRGSCVGRKCGLINATSLVDELSEANTYPGITYCTESCGFWGCDCGFPSSGCLFYRVYKKPVSTEIYEIFQCPTWYETVNISLGNLSLYWQEHLYLRIPLLTTQFIRKNSAIAIIPSNTQVTYACANSNLTHLEECTVKDTCKCTPAQNEVNCYCTDDQVSNIFNFAVHSSSNVP